MATVPNTKKEKVTVAIAPGPSAATAVIPNSARYMGFVFQVVGFNPGKDFNIQASFDGTNFYNLDSDSFVLGTTHFTSSATPQIFQLELFAPFPGGIRIRSVDANLTVDGTVDVMMAKCPYRPR